MDTASIPPAWVVLPDNSAVSKWVLAENTKAVAVEQVTIELNRFRERVRQTIDEVRKEVENGWLVGMHEKAPR